MHVDIYTDGSSRGNPGSGGYGTVIEYTDSQGRLYMREYSGGYLKTTNNRMELMGVIVGLEALTKPCAVDIYSDSQYIVKAFHDHWIDGWIRTDWRQNTNKPVKNMDLWKRLLAVKKNHVVEFHWIKGHAGHPQNERCDALATQAADKDNLKVDEGYLQTL